MANEKKSFIGTTGQPIARENLRLYKNTGTGSTPVWAVIGKRVQDSSMELDWSADHGIDILGEGYGSLRAPLITQQFDGAKPIVGDAAIEEIYNLALVKHDHIALSAQDLLVEHKEAGWAERYETCTVEVTGYGGEGGGDVVMPFTVTFGGTRTLGTITRENGVVTFVPDGE